MASAKRKLGNVILMNFHKKPLLLNRLTRYAERVGVTRTTLCKDILAQWVEMELEKGNGITWVYPRKADIFASIEKSKRGPRKKAVK